VPKNSKLISEAYHKAKADGSNPELVSAVESLLSKEQTPKQKEDEQEKPTKEDGKPLPKGVRGLRTETEEREASAQLRTEKEEVKPELTPAEKTNLESVGEQVGKNFREVQNVYAKYGEGKPLSEITAEDYRKAQEKREASKAPDIEQVAQKSGITPKNLKDLYSINRDLFGLNRVQAFASAIAMDRMVGAMAKRAGITKAEMYGKLKFEKASEQDLPQGVKMQVDAWHGSPYQFDKFELSKIGTGEGAQAFGWGLYFTDLESIAKNYAEKLAKSKMTILTDGKKINLDSDTFTNAEEIAYGTLEVDYTVEKAIKRLEYNQTKRPQDDNLKAIEILKRTKVEGGRSLYKVSLHKGKTPSEYTWLEWDKNLSENIINNLISIKDIKDIINEKLIVKRNLEKKFADKGIEKKFVNEITGKQLYEGLSKKLGGDKQASLFLLENGIDGIKYPAESISRGATSDTARGFNYVVFDENAVSIEEVIKFQKDAEKARGAMMTTLDGQAVIYALTDPNVSTPLHELAHVFEHYLTDAEKATVIKNAGTKGWTTETSEYFARGFEKYLAEGKSPIEALNKVFAKFKEWLTEIYNGIKGSGIDVKLNNEMRSIYDKMLGVEKLIDEQVVDEVAEKVIQARDAKRGYDKKGGRKKAFETQATLNEKAQKAMEGVDTKAPEYETVKVIEENIDDIMNDLMNNGLIEDTDCVL
jgi:hypothetical protein